jgi:hypothetical protein
LPLALRLLVLQQIPLLRARVMASLVTALALVTCTSGVDRQAKGLATVNPVTALAPAICIGGVRRLAMVPACAILDCALALDRCTSMVSKLGMALAGANPVMALALVICTSGAVVRGSYYKIS